MNEVVPVLLLCKKCSHFQALEEEQTTFGGHISYHTIYWCYKHPPNDFDCSYLNPCAEHERICVGTNYGKDHAGPNPVPNYCPYKLEHILIHDRSCKPKGV